MENEFVFDPKEYGLCEEGGAKAYENSRKAAEKLVKNPDQLEKLLNNMETNLKRIPRVGDLLANVPVLISMVRSYINREYTLLPFSSLIAIVTSLVYFLSPIDLIPDAIPVVGHVDDALVIAVTVACIKSDVDTYKQWREEQQSAAETEAGEAPDCRTDRPGPFAE